MNFQAANEETLQAMESLAQIADEKKNPALISQGYKKVANKPKLNKAGSLR